LARPDWSRELPQSLKIPTITTLRTLGDIRALLGHMPAERRQLKGKIEPHPLKPYWTNSDALNSIARGKRCRPRWSFPKLFSIRVEPYATTKLS